MKDLATFELDSKDLSLAGYELGTEHIGIELLH
jgi:hypothetical protein